MSKPEMLNRREWSIVLAHAAHRRIRTAWPDRGRMVDIHTDMDGRIYISTDRLPGEPGTPGGSWEITGQILNRPWNDHLMTEFSDELADRFIRYCKAILAPSRLSRTMDAK